MDVKIEESWKKVLSDEFEKPYFKILTEFVKEEYKTHTIYPEGKNIFNAFNLCPFDNVKVVIIGQDPYHEPMQAHGFVFFGSGRSAVSAVATKYFQGDRVGFGHYDT